MKRISEFATLFYGTKQVQSLAVGKTGAPIELRYGRPALALLRSEFATRRFLLLRSASLRWRPRLRLRLPPGRESPSPRERLASPLSSGFSILPSSSQDLKTLPHSTARFDCRCKTPPVAAFLLSTIRRLVLGRCVVEHVQAIYSVHRPPSEEYTRTVCAP